MLSVPCGLPAYRGTWPPVVAGAPMIEPLADLARCSAHGSTTDDWLELMRGLEEPSPEAREADQLAT